MDKQGATMLTNSNDSSTILSADNSTVKSTKGIVNANGLGPTANSVFCKHVSFRSSDCHICVDICPTDAISLPLGPEINQNCINCGLCQIACPTETFEAFYDTDNMLRNLLQEETNDVINNEQMYFHCHQAEAHNRHSIPINCAGNLTENGLLSVASSNAKRLTINTGNCQNCQLFEGKKLFEAAGKKFTKLSNAIFQAQLTITLRENQKPSQQPSALSRRDFFRSILAGATQQVATVVAEKEQNIVALLQTDSETAIKKRPSPRRELLKSILTEQRHDTSHQARNVPLPWKKMHVDAEHCVGCGICVHVCPTEALVKHVSAMELTRTINYSLCTNCGICAEACPQNVIHFEQSYNIDDVINDSDEIVAVVPLNSCLICGEIIPELEGEICTTCQKRQISPMFM